MENVLHQAKDTFNLDFSSTVYTSSSFSSSPQHFHKNFEFIIATEGNCLCRINGKDYKLSKGDALFVCPFQIHSFSFDEGSSVRQITFHEHLILTVSRSLEGRVPQDPVFHPSAELLELLLKKIDSFWNCENISFARIPSYEKRVQIKGLLYLLCGEFLETASLTDLNRSNKITMDIVQYISKNFQKNISLAEIAKEKGYNSQYISRAFNKAMGISFKKMLNQFRLEYAYAMLQDTDLPIAYVCFESGYQSIRSFNHECKITFGKTPKELRMTRNNTKEWS